MDQHAFHHVPVADMLDLVGQDPRHFFGGLGLFQEPGVQGDPPAQGRVSGPARLKWCGKSAPAPW